jgi:hypothetical protein
MTALSSARSIAATKKWIVASRGWIAAAAVAPVVYAVTEAAIPARMRATAVRTVLSVVPYWNVKSAR